MLSRVADSLYWMARYLERAEHTARLLGVHLNLMLDHPSSSEADRGARIFESLATPPPAGLHRDIGPIIHYLTLQPANPSSIFSSIAAARRNARQLRDHISSEMWGQINRLHLRLGHAEAAEILAYDPQGLLREVVDGVSLFHGLTLSTINHGECWQFIETGIYLERASGVAALLAAHFRHFPPRLSQEETLGEADLMECVGLLRVCGAFEAYCNRNTAHFWPERIAEFLLLDPDFPKAVRYAAEAAEASLRRIAELNQGPPNPGLHRTAGHFATLLREAKMEAILSGALGDGGLYGFLGTARTECGLLHEAIYRSFVDYPVEEALEPV